MDTIRKSLHAIGQKATNVLQSISNRIQIADDVSESSVDDIECSSDCSQCASELRSISLASSSRNSLQKHFIEIAHKRRKISEPVDENEVVDLEELRYKSGMGSKRSSKEPAKKSLGDLIGEINQLPGRTIVDGQSKENRLSDEFKEPQMLKIPNFLQNSGQKRGKLDLGNPNDRVVLPLPTSSRKRKFSEISNSDQRYSHASQNNSKKALEEFNLEHRQHVQRKSDCNAPVSEDSHEPSEPRQGSRFSFGPNSHQSTIRMLETESVQKQATSDKPEMQVSGTVISYPQSQVKAITEEERLVQAIERRIADKAKFLIILKNKMESLQEQKQVQGLRSKMDKSPIVQRLGAKQLEQNMEKKLQSGKPSYSLHDLKTTSMAMQKTLEMISSFDSLRLFPKREPEHVDLTCDKAQEEVKETASTFDMTKSQYDINELYMDIVQQKVSKQGNFREDIVIKNEALNYELNKGSVARLQPRKWFNDEILNGYVALINEREARTGQDSVFVFNTFFYTMLEDMVRKNSFSFERLNRVVKRKKVNLKNYRMVIVPININSYHWFLLAVDLINDRFLVFDSLKASKAQADGFVQTFIPFFQEYLHAEKAGRYQCETNLALWRTEVPNTPLQNNGYDCGLCSALNMEILSRRPVPSSLNYEVSSKFSDDSRKRIFIELMFGSLLTLKSDQS